MNLAANKLVALLQSDEYDYPLVTVEIGKKVLLLLIKNKCMYDSYLM